MNKVIKVLINLFIFLIVAGFIAYTIRSMNQDDKVYINQSPSQPFVSKYEKTFTIEVKDSIKNFDTDNKRLFVLTNHHINVLDLQGNTVNTFGIKPNARDLMISPTEVFILYPTFIDVYSHQGDSLNSWNACSELSDYCAITLAGGFVFVTDAENKNICKYTKEGNFVKFIDSPQRFVTPSYDFDITSRNDTLYCVNPGRHLIETYSLDGEFIAAFGGMGTEKGFFAGCCNPVFISFTADGDLLTSEKGNPRISRFTNDGTFSEVIFNNRLLGGGYKAHEVKEIDNQLFVASLNQISIYKKKKING